jgi:hypothetical protein
METSMRNNLAISYPPGRDISDPNLVDELARHLVTGRQDVSDPDECFRFLLDLDVCRPLKLQQLFDKAIYEAGQLYIAREMTRQAG